MVPVLACLEIPTISPLQPVLFSAGWLITFYLRRHTGNDRAQTFSEFCLGGAELGEGVGEVFEFVVELLLYLA